MKNKLIQQFSKPLLLCLLTMALPASSTISATGPAAEKMKPEEVIAKHLDSIGTAAARAAARNRIISGVATLTGRQGIKGVAEGKALMASEGNKHLVAMSFASPDIPEEKWAYNGKKLTVALQRASSTPSPLAQYFLGSDFFFTEGLIGGTLSSAWPLLDFTDKRAKLEYSGTDKINGREAHKIRYTPRKGSDYKITMYFDAENFHHLRTQYDRSVAATMGATPMQSGSQLETRYRVTEDFSDFKEESGLTLPTTYKLELQIQSGRSPILLDWVFNLTQFLVNQSMTEKDFEIGD